MKNKKILFLTESPGIGKVDKNYSNMRTEYAGMYALDAYHISIELFLTYPQKFVDNLIETEYVFVILPKNPKFYENDILITKIEQIKLLIGCKFIFIQEGPHHYFEDYPISSQIFYLELISMFNGILCHNEYDVPFYRGMFPNIPVMVIPSLMLENNIKDVKWKPQEKVIIGGNLCSWYGGIKSVYAAWEFELPVYAHKSGRSRESEGAIYNLLPWMNGRDWIKSLSTFKYAVNLMPTVAAGTFSLNCAYFGIPCIGNILVDTQKNCFPKLSVTVNDIEGARNLARLLKNDEDFYDMCSKEANEMYRNLYNIDIFKHTINTFLEKLN